MLRGSHALWLAGAVVVMLGACSGDEGGDVEAFCAGADAFDQDQSADFGDLAEDAPEEVAEDVELLVRVSERLAEGAGEIDPNDPTAGFEVYRELETDPGEVAAAARRVEAFRAENC